MKQVIVTTGNEVSEKQIKEVLGIVCENTIRARNIGRDIGASFKNVIGG